MGKIGSSIYNLNAELEQINEALIENEGELTEELEARLDSVEISKKDIVDSLQRLISLNKSEDEIIAAEIKRLQAIKKARANAVEGLKRWLLNVMTRNGITRIDGEFCKVSISEGRESVTFDEQALMVGYDKLIESVRKNLPPYVKIDTEISKTELLNYLKAGQPIKEGAAAIVRNPYLLIK